MKKYYVIKLPFDAGFWNEEEQDFRGWLKATKYLAPPVVEYDNGELIVSNNCGYNLHFAISKKPCVILEVYENE